MQFRQDPYYSQGPYDRATAVNLQICPHCQKRCDIFATVCPHCTNIIPEEYRIAKNLPDDIFLRIFRVCLYPCGLILMGGLYGVLHLIIDGIFGSYFFPEWIGAFLGFLFGVFMFTVFIPGFIAEFFYCMFSVKRRYVWVPVAGLLSLIMIQAALQSLFH